MLNGEAHSGGGVQAKSIRGMESYGFWILDGSQQTGREFNGADARLERCWWDLTEVREQRSTVAAIAFGWGFSGLRTFNRAFAARCGMTSTAARKNSGGV